MYEIYNYKTGYEMGRTFPTKKQADDFIKYLKSGTNTKLFWRARKVKAQKNPASPMDALKSLVGSTVKIVKRGNQVVAEVLKGKPKAKRKNPAGFMAGGVFHPIRSGERWTRDKQGAIYMNKDVTPYSPKLAGEAKKKKAATKKRRKNPDAKYRFKIDGMPKDSAFNSMPFGRQMEYRGLISAFKARAKSVHISQKRKSTAAALADFKKLYQPHEYFLMDTSGPGYRDDSIQVWYTN